MKYQDVLALNLCHKLWAARGAWGTREKVNNPSGTLFLPGSATTSYTCGSGQQCPSPNIEPSPSPGWPGVLCSWQYIQAALWEASINAYKGAGLKPCPPSFVPHKKSLPSLLGPSDSGGFAPAAPGCAVPPTPGWMVWVSSLLPGGCFQDGEAAGPTGASAIAKSSSHLQLPRSLVSHPRACSGPHSAAEQHVSTEPLQRGVDSDWHAEGRSWQHPLATAGGQRGWTGHLRVSTGSGEGSWPCPPVGHPHCPCMLSPLRQSWRGRAPVLFQRGCCEPHVGEPQPFPSQLKKADV